MVLIERRDDYVNEEERNTKNKEKKIMGVGGGEKRGRIFFERFRVDLV